MKKRVEVKPFWYSDLMVMPMPITIITTLNKSGMINAAPYSLVIPYSIPNKKQGILIGLRKHSHTYKNIMETKEFVVNFPTSSHLEDIMVMGRFYPEGVNELEHTSLTPIDSLEVRPQSIMECPQHIECTLYENIEIDRVQAKIIGSIVAIIMNEELVNMDRGKRIEHFNPPIYIGDEKRRSYYYGTVNKITTLELDLISKMQGDDKVITNIVWEEAALKGLNEVPSFIRQIVVDMLEGETEKEGKDMVTYGDFKKMLKDYAPPEVLERFI